MFLSPWTYVCNCTHTTFLGGECLLASEISLVPHGRIQSQQDKKHIKPSERIRLVNQSRTVGDMGADRLVISSYKCSHHQKTINVPLTAMVRCQILPDPGHRGAHSLKGELFNK